LTGGGDRATTLFNTGLITLDTLSMMQAEMELVGSGLAGAQRVIADAEGRFVFRSLPKGSFPITATLPGYLAGAFGRYRHDGPSRPVELDDSERKTDVVIRMWKYASISGIVVDEAGEPAVGVQVRALRRVTAGNTARLVVGQSSYTDDRGYYRLASLTPGEYFIAVPSTTTTVPASTVEEYLQAINSGNTERVFQERAASGAPPPSLSGTRIGDYQIQSTGGRSATMPPPGEDGQLAVYRTAFHPAAPTSADAIAIAVGSGDDRQNVNVNLSLMPAVFVAGVVTGPDGPMNGLGVRLVPAELQPFSIESGFETAQTATDASGRFTFLGVPPGQYILKALYSPMPGIGGEVRALTVVGGIAMVAPSGPGPASPPPSGPTLWTEMPLAVGDRNVTDLHLAMRVGARVAGRIEFAGAAPQPPPQRLQQISIMLTPAEPRPINRAQPGRPSPTGEFTTGGYPPGRYLLQASAPGPPWSVRSILLNGRNVLDEPFDLAGADLTGAVVTYTDQQTQLTISVQGSAAKDFSDVLVVAFPADYRKWIDDGMTPRRARSVTVSRTGQALLAGISPGEYLAAAVPADMPVELQNPRSIEALARIATKVTVVEGDKKTQMLTVATGR
jgi:hypothetical protein